jgi:hypothetical protein
MIDIMWRRNGTSVICRGTMSREKFLKHCEVHTLFVTSTAQGTTLGWYDQDTQTTVWTKIQFEESY